MVAASKLTPLYYTCYELGHTWTPSCMETMAISFKHSAVYGLKLFGSLYLLSLFMQWKKDKKGGGKYVQEYVKSLIRSLLFICWIASGYSGVFCFLRHMLGHFNFYSTAYLPGFIVCIMSYYIESAEKRPILLWYFINAASDTLRRMLSSRGLIKPVKNGEVIMFSVAASVILYHFKSGQLQGLMNTITRYVIGQHELTKPKTTTPPVSSNGFANHSVNQSSGTLNNLWETVKKYHSTVMQYLKSGKSHSSCNHPDSCLYYSIEGSLKTFTVGYVVQLVAQLLISYKKMKRVPNLFYQAVTKKSTFTFGTFLVVFRLGFRVMSCLLRWSRGKDASWHAIPAGMVAGTSFMLWRNQMVSWYLLWKMLAIVYESLVSSGMVPHVPGVGVLIFAMCGGILTHSAVFEPHNLNPSYYNYMDKISGSRIWQMNRSLLTVYGLDSTLLFPDFWPQYDGRFLSETMKDIISQRKLEGR